MKYEYDVTAQFAKPNAPSFYTRGYRELLEQAKDYFNARSCLATNEKKILRLTIVDDKTLNIVFISDNKINPSQVSRSLRVFIMYLIDETHKVNFSKLVTAKRLFKTKATESIYAESDEREADNEIMSLEHFRTLDVDAKLEAIYELLRRQSSC